MEAGKLGGLIFGVTAGGQMEGEAGFSVVAFSQRETWRHNICRTYRELVHCFGPDANA